MTVTYFSKTSIIGPSSRYRVFQFLPYFQAGGIDCRVDPLFGEIYFSILEVRRPALRTLLKFPYVLARFLRRLWTLLTLGGRDLVVIEGQLFPYVPPLAERLLRWCRYRMVVEMDDAIYLTRGHDKKMPVLLSMATGTIVGNERLAAYAKRFSSRACVVPTVVDTDRFIPDRSRFGGTTDRSSEPITIVWIGLAYNLKYLDLVAPAIGTLQSRFPVKLRVVCSRPPEMPRVDIEFRSWDFSGEVSDLQDADIGVMPLEDTEWARGKCGLKLLQYLAVGLPVVASPVGVNCDIITNGENGFLASTGQEWYDSLERLCRQPDLRMRIGRAGRRTVEERYSLAVWGPRLVDLYRTFAQSERGDVTEGPVHRPLSGHGQSTGMR
ncbi:MAG: Glycosyl transferase, group 1 [Nitrospira sp.]|jgi:glycosyltransferase involved in cell wall biosynthesis|nr:MAG: Glycosyl transferase, group 1 [Nitrospira sp.]